MHGVSSHIPGQIYIVPKICSTFIPNFMRDYAKKNNKIPQKLFLVNIVKYLFFPEILIKKVTNLTDTTIRDTIMANLTPPNTEI
jgi:hypothetical protein